MCKKLSVLASRVSNFRSVTRRPERPPSVIPTSRVLWLVAFAVVWTMTGYGGIAMGQVAGVDDPSDMADSSGDIKRIEAWVENGNLHLTMTVYGVFAPAVTETPAGMTNRYYYHWLLDTDNNPDTGYLNDEYEGNATNLETPIGVDLVVQFGWRDGNTNGVYAYDPLTEVSLFEDYEYTIEGDTIHAVIPLADLGLTPDDIIAVSAFQEGASNGWQVDWIESFELTLEDTSGQVGSVDDPLDMADSSGDIKRIEAWVDEGNLHLTMTVYGVFAPSVEDTPAGMTNRYYYHWLLDTDNNPDTGYLNDEYEGNATNLETPIGVDLVVQFGWRDGNTNGVYAYDPLTEVSLFEDYEYTIEGDTIHAVIPLEDLGLELGQTIAVSAFQEGASNGWQCDWIESFELTLEDTTVSAYNPNPADGALHESTSATLSWSPDEVAVSQDVYFGDNYDDVANGTGDTFRVNQGRDINFYIVGVPGFAYPDGLVPGTTYYWRIDEVNEADPRSPWKGNVWSFTIPPRTAYNPDPADGAEFVDPNAALSWTAGYGARTHTVYFGDNFDDVNNDTGGDSIGAASYIPGPLESEKVYYWRVDEYDAIDTYKGDVWSFTTPGAVGNPQPSNGAIDVQMTATLSWTPADNAASHQVYFGTDKDAVRNADTASPEYIGTRNLGLENYDPGKLAWNTIYYWRVDEVYDADPANPVKGPLWSFTTADFLVVDDIESYNDIEETEPGSNIIYDTWIDGWEDPTNGSIVGYPMPPHTEVKIVHGGSQSMPYSYDNDLKYSEATLPLVWPRDWTEEGVEVLSLWFYGDASNAAEQMYVALNGSATVYHDNPSAAQTDDWTQWTIDLEEFAAQGVDLTNVNTISIGFGDKNNPQAGGSGLVFFDDIRLYRPKPAEKVIFLFDDFEGYADDAGLAAAGWAMLDTPTATEDSTWTITNPGGRANPPTLNGSASTGNFMISDSDTQSISGDQDNGASHDLYTPSFSTLGGSTVWLHADVSAQLNNNGTAIFDVEVSTDGNTWINVFSCVSPGRGTLEPATTRLPDNTNADGYFGRLDLDLSAVAADSAAVQVRFRHYEPDWDWWIAIDNVLVDDVAAPQGGPITVFSEEFSNGLGQMEVFSGQGNTGTETWHTTDKGGRYVPGTVQERGVNRLGPHPGATPDFAIIDSDTDPDPVEDEWLMTPTLDLSGMTEVSLHYESETVMSSGVWNQEVLVSLDGGSTFETTPIFAYTGGGLFDNGEEPVFTERIFDVSSIAAGESQVVFAFRYTGDGDDWWWAIDNVEVSGRSGE